MKLHELFDTVPVHSRLVLEVVDNDMNTMEERKASEWCDDAMPREFYMFANCEIYDIKGDVSGVLRIVVTAKDRLVKSRDGWVYIAQSGKRYEIAELRVPNSNATYDIAVLMSYDEDKVGACDTEFINYFFGINGIEDSELIEICRDYVARYEKKI